MKYGRRNSPQTVRAYFWFHILFSIL